MSLGWGLRGDIGGGSYGAMIPGAMISLVICLLLEIPSTIAGTIVAFGAIGTGMGGQMTYGQTIGFLHETPTVVLGIWGVTVKGGVWGILTGSFIGIGLVHKRIKFTIILTGFILFLAGFITGLKFINQPKLLYFSDALHHPRNELWAGLLVGALFKLTYLGVILKRKQFRVIWRFSLYGMTGGAIGFGGGVLWMLAGFQYSKDFFFRDWWKLMEFSFGFIMGGFIGGAAWLTRNSNIEGKTLVPVVLLRPPLHEFAAVCIMGLVLFIFIPVAGIPSVAGINDQSHTASIVLSLHKLTLSYSFIGCLILLLVLRLPFVAFQAGITLTFAHTVIDLMTDKNLFPEIYSYSWLTGSIIFLSSTLIAWLVIYLERRPMVLRSNLLLLIWSMLTVAITRMGIHSGFRATPGHTFLQILTGDLFVFDVFFFSAVIISFMILKPYRAGAG